MSQSLSCALTQWKSLARWSVLAGLLLCLTAPAAWATPALEEADQFDDPTYRDPMAPHNAQPLQPPAAPTTPATPRPPFYNGSLAHHPAPIHPSPQPQVHPPNYRHVQDLPLHTQHLLRFIQHNNRSLSLQQAYYLAHLIEHVSQHYNVDYRIVASVIAVESSFRVDAVSSSGAIGLGQLKPETAQWLGVRDPYDPLQNIAGCAKYLQWLNTKYHGSWDFALSAYYQGPGTIDRAGKITDNALPYLYKVRDKLVLFKTT